MNWISLDMLTAVVRRGLHQIPLSVDGVIGVARSGMIPATQIALARELPLADVDSALEGRWWRRPTTHQDEPRHVLVVEDAVYRGRAIGGAVATLANTYPQVTTLAAFRDPTHADVDIWCADLPAPRIMEWNVWRHTRTHMIATDLDGVLCPDPPPGCDYDDWIVEAEPLVVPPLPVGHIITARVELYRPETEAWLKEWGIRYGKLWMIANTEAERRRQRLHVPHKVDSYRKSDAWLFIESDSRQAELIATQARLPVVDWSTREERSGR